VRDSREFTPLHKAAHHGNAVLVEALLQRGAQASARTDVGQTAADLAIKEGHPEILKMLQAHV
jgi:ankyrin repeat protein